MNRFLLAAGLLIHGIAHAQTESLYRVLCVEGAAVDIGVIYAESTSPESLKKLKQQGYFSRVSKQPRKVSRECTLSGKNVEVTLSFDPAHTRRCGGNPNSYVSVSLDKKLLVANQQLHNTCEGWGIVSLSLNEFELVLCAADISYTESACQRFWVNDILSGKREVSVKKLFEKAAHNNALQPTAMSPLRGSMASLATLGAAERGRWA